MTGEKPDPRLLLLGAYRALSSDPKHDELARRLKAAADAVSPGEGRSYEERERLAALFGSDDAWCQECGARRGDWYDENGDVCPEHPACGECGDGEPPVSVRAIARRLVLNDEDAQARQQRTVDLLTAALVDAGVLVESSRESS